MLLFQILVASQRRNINAYYNQVDQVRRWQALSLPTPYCFLGIKKAIHLIEEDILLESNNIQSSWY